jgi:hypothetical protein
MKLIMTSVLAGRHEHETHRLLPITFLLLCPYVILRDAYKPIFCGPSVALGKALGLRLNKNIILKCISLK